MHSSKTFGRCRINILATCIFDEKSFWVVIERDAEHSTKIELLSGTKIVVNSLRGEGVGGQNKQEDEKLELGDVSSQFSYPRNTAAAEIRRYHKSLRW